MTDKIPEESKWFKVYNNIFDDEAIQIILDMPEGPVIFLIWMRLLALASKTNDRGLIYFKKNIPYSIDEFTTIFKQKNRQIQFALKIFQKFLMIKFLDSGEILILNWEKYQNIEQLEKIRQKNNERQKRYRERQKVLSQENEVPLLEVKSNVTCNVTDNVTVTECNGTDIDIDKELDNISSISNSINTTTTNNENFCNVTCDQKLYGEFGNVCLTSSEYSKMLGICCSQKLLDELIEELSCAIGVGKYPPYKADAPNAHFILLRNFYDYRKTHPKANTPANDNKPVDEQVKYNEIVDSW